MTDPEDLPIVRADTMQSPKAWRLAVSWVLLAVLYMVTARLSVAWISAGDDISPIYASAGIAFGALLLLGWKAWPGVWAAVYLLEAGYGGAGWMSAFAQATGYTLALLVGAWLFGLWAQGPPRIGQVNDILFFLLVGGLVVPFLIVVAIAVTRAPVAAMWGETPQAFSIHWLSEMLSILLMTPLLLAWRDGVRSSLEWRYVVEFFFLVLFACLSAGVAFGYFLPQDRGQQALTVLVAPFLVWAMLRFHMRGVTVALIIVAFFVQWSVIRGVGPFAGSSPAVSSLVAQLYLLVVVVTALVVSAVLQERSVARERALLGERIIEQTGEGVMITTPDEVIVSVNPAFSETTGYAPEEVIGRTPALLQSGLHDTAFYREMKRSLQKTGRWQGEIWNRRKDGEVYSELLSISTLHDEKGRPFRYVGMFTDLSRQPRIEERIRRLAYYDVLTHLPNRQLFMDRLDLALVQVRRHGARLALLYLDLDRFKPINDNFGHPVGDRVLQIFAARLQSCVRHGDTCARLGGDEFTALLLDIHREEDVVQVAEKVWQGLQSPFEVEGEMFDVSVSIGAALYPQHGEDAATLLGNADRAMYEAKRDGRDTFRFFSG